MRIIRPLASLHHPLVAPSLALSLCLCLLPLATRAQNAPCPNPNTGHPGTVAERAARFQAAAEAAANATPPDPCVMTFLARAESLTGPSNTQPRANAHSIELLRTALANAETAWGPDNIKLVPFLSDLAQEFTLVRTDAGTVDPARSKEAEGLVRRAMDLTQAAYGPDDIHLAPLLSLLARTFTPSQSPVDVLPQITQQEQIFERELAIEEKAYGADSFRITATLWRLAALYSNENVVCNMPYSGHQLSPQEYTDCTNRALDKANAVLQRDVAILNATPAPGGGQNPSLTLPLSSLAQNEIREHKYAQAQDAYREMAEIDANHNPQGVVSDDMQLANAYESANDYASARDTLLKALDLANQLPPPKNPSPYMPPTANVLNSLGQLALRQQDVPGAKAYFQQELDLLSKGRPDNDPALLQALFSMANGYMSRNQLDDAAPLFQRVISIAETNPPATTDVVAARNVQTAYLQSLRDYANLLVRSHRESEAAAVYVKLIGVTNTDDVLAASAHASAMSNYAQLLRNENQLEEAHAVLQQLISLSQSDPAMAFFYPNALRADASLLRQMNQPDDAAKLDALLKTYNDKTAAAAQHAGAPSPGPAPQPSAASPTSAPAP